MSIICLVFLTILAATAGEKCQQTRDRLGRIKADYKWTWTIRETKGKLIPVLNVSWSLHSDTSYDGWFYRLENIIPDDYPYDDYDYDYYEDEDYDLSRGYDESNCTRLLSQSWKHEKLTEEEINVTCHRLCHEKICHFNNYCMRVQEERFKLISKNETSLELMLDFGVQYDFRSYAAYNYILSDIIGNEVIQPVFCVDYYVKDGLSEREAREKCNGTTSGFDYGPVYDYKVVDRTYNLTDNTVVATISWKRPLHFKQGENITKYGICDAYKHKLMELKQAYDNDPDHLYQYNITRKQGDKLSIWILPNDDKCRFEWNRSKYFPRYKVTFAEIDVCNTTVTPSYCDQNAFCDNKYEGEGKCGCYVGYEGNGVNTYWNGEGCKVTCATKEYVNNHTCHEKANCTDTNDGVMCYCPEGYTGDGYRKSLGCTTVKKTTPSPPSPSSRTGPTDTCGFNIGLIILAVLLMIIILVIITCVILKRRKRRKQKRSNGNSSQVTADLEEANHLVKEKGLQSIVTSLEMQNLTRSSDDISNCTCPIKAA